MDFSEAGRKFWLFHNLHPKMFFQDFEIRSIYSEKHIFEMMSYVKQICIFKNHDKSYEESMWFT